MNKKIIGIGVAVVVVAILIVGAVMATKKKSAPQDRQVPAESQQAATEQPVKPQGSIISSIKDAIGMGTPMKCTYTVKNGASSVESTVFVKGMQYKSMVTVGGKSVSSLFDGDTIYTWTDGESTGTKMTKSCMEELKSSLPTNQINEPTAPVSDPADSFDAATGVSCAPSTEADFSIPTNITFTDQCETIKKSLEMMKNVKLPANMPNIPADIPAVPNGIQQ